MFYGILLLTHVYTHNWTIIYIVLLQSYCRLTCMHMFYLSPMVHLEHRFSSFTGLLAPTLLNSLNHSFSVYRVSDGKLGEKNLPLPVSLKI